LGLVNNKLLIVVIIALGAALFYQNQAISQLKQKNLSVDWVLTNKETELKECQTLAEYRLKTINALNTASGIDKYYK